MANEADKKLFPALLFCLLLPLPSPVLAAGLGDVPPAGASAAVPGLGDGGNSGGVTDPDDSGNGLDDNAADPDDSGGNPGSGMDPAILQPFLAQYQEDSARRQVDSEILRFALIAVLAVWAGKTVTQRRHR